MAKIRDTLDKQEVATQTMEETLNPLERYRTELEILLAREDFGSLDAKSQEALEQFPSIPFFYYVRGLVLMHNGKNPDAITVLEEGLSYLLDDTALADKIYARLAEAYAAIGNNSKANMYLSKIKSGS